MLRWREGAPRTGWYWCFDLPTPFATIFNRQNHDFHLPLRTYLLLLTTTPPSTHSARFDLCFAWFWVEFWSECWYMNFQVFFPRFWIWDFRYNTTNWSGFSIVFPIWNGNKTLDLKPRKIDRKQAWQRADLRKRKASEEWIIFIILVIIFLHEWLNHHQNRWICEI